MRRLGRSLVETLLYKCNAGGFLAIAILYQENMYLKLMQQQAEI